jgi:hypothetical protein
MSEKDLGEALLKLDAAALAGVSDHRQQVWSILERDRRRVRMLTWVVVVTWLLAGALVLTGLISYGFVFPMQAKVFKQIEEGKLTPKQANELQRTVLISFQMTTLLIAWSVFLMAAAALCTVFLILASRRATLRQVNASLVEIGEQLKRLRQPPPPAT